MKTYVVSVRHEKQDVPVLKASTTHTGAKIAIACAMDSIRHELSMPIPPEGDESQEDADYQAIEDAMEFGHTYVAGFYITVTHVEVTGGDA